MCQEWKKIVLSSSKAHPHLPPCSSSITKVLIPASLLYASRAMVKKGGKEGEIHVENKIQRKRGEIEHTKHKAHLQRDIFLDHTGDNLNCLMFFSFFLD